MFYYKSFSVLRDSGIAILCLFGRFYEKSDVTSIIRYQQMSEIHSCVLRLQKSFVCFFWLLNFSVLRRWPSSDLTRTVLYRRRTITDSLVGRELNPRAVHLSTSNIPRIKTALFMHKNKTVFFTLALLQYIKIFRLFIK